MKRSQQRCVNETEALRRVLLLELCQKDHERRASVSEEQRSQRNERLREYR